MPEDREVHARIFDALDGGQKVSYGYGVHVSDDTFGPFSRVSLVVLAPLMPEYRVDPELADIAGRGVAERR